LIKESCARFAEEMRLQPLSHCVYPRTGAAHAVIDVLGPLSRCGGGPPIEYIIDATLGYPNGIVPDISMRIFSCFPDSGVCIHYEVIRVNPEWHDESKLQGFLYKRYQEKDRLLEEFYKTNAFPGEPRPVVVSQIMMLFSQVRFVHFFFSYIEHHRFKILSFQ
uniref:Acyltransf_C domain-containing protein n=1 Tax=Angiostrongylus cantonensis TaxID=6313 RepID=A0A0K0DQK8_ANGCA